MNWHEMTEEEREKQREMWHREQKLPGKNYCCRHMDDIADEQEVAIHYDPVLREYAFDKQEPLKRKIRWHITQPVERDVLIYCPWCGRKLPTSLRKKYLTLVKPYGITSIDELKEKRKYADFENAKRFDVGFFTELALPKKIMTKLPDEFKTDAWWRKRGL